MTRIVRKGFAYITNANRLLLFTQPEAPEAGIQVPAGTVHDGEDVVTGALREATEETALTQLRVVRVLGEERVDFRPFGRDELHDRTFVHLICDGEPPETWRHGEKEPSFGSEEWIPFDFFWASLPHGVPSLIGRHDRFLPELLRSLAELTQS